MRILIVAPLADLSTLTELISAVGNNLPTILNGTVTHRELLATLKTAEFDIVHFAGHGASMTLEMSDGPLSIDLLASAIAKHPALVFLNACESLPAAAAMYSYGTGYAIGWRDGVPDVVAEEFGVVFYRTLALNGGQIRKAFDTAEDAVTRTHPGAELPTLLNGRMTSIMQELQEFKERQKLLMFAGPVVAVIALFLAILAIAK